MEGNRKITSRRGEGKHNGGKEALRDSLKKVELAS